MGKEHGDGTGIDPRGGRQLSLAEMVRLCEDEEQKLAALDQYLGERSVLNASESIDRVQAIIHEALPELYNDPRVLEIVKKRRGLAIDKQSGDERRGHPQSITEQQPARLPTDKFGPILGDGKPRYVVIEQIGFGGQGAVYQCQDRKFSGSERSTVAIKVYHSHHPRGEGIRTRRVEHECVVRVHDDGIDPETGLAYLVEEYINGQSLENWIKQEKPSTRRSIELMLKLCSGVEAAHRVLIMHRDLKPANVLMVGDQPKIVDFGISVARDEYRSPSGSPLYQAPEIEAGDGGDTRVDIYGLGVLMKILLTRTMPGVMDGDGHGVIQDKALKSIVRKCVAPLPSNRYGSVEALAADLRAYLEHRPVRAHKSSKFGLLKLSLRRNWVASLVVVLMFLGVLLATGSVLYSQQQMLARNHDEQVGLIKERAGLTKQIDDLEILNSHLRHNQDMQARIIASSALSMRIEEGSEGIYPNPAIFASILSIIETGRSSDWAYHLLVRSEGTAMLREVVASRSSDPSVSPVTAGYWWLLLARVEKKTPGSQPIMVERAYRRARGAFMSVLEETDPIVKELNAEFEAFVQGKDG